MGKIYPIINNMKDSQNVKNISIEDLIKRIKEYEPLDQDEEKILLGYLSRFGWRSRNPMHPAYSSDVA